MLGEGLLQSRERSPGLGGGCQTNEEAHYLPGEGATLSVGVTLRWGTGKKWWWAKDDT